MLMLMQSMIHAGESVSLEKKKMAAILIKADSKSSKLLKELAEKLGGNVTTITEEQYEDVLLGSLMDKEKTGKNTSRAIDLIAPQCA